jgi:hypothetical protein
MGLVSSDKVMKALNHDYRRPTDLDRRDVTRLYQLIEFGSTNSDHLRCAWNPDCKWKHFQSNEVMVLHADDPFLLVSIFGTPSRDRIF